MKAMVGLGATAKPVFSADQCQTSWMKLGNTTSHEKKPTAKKTVPTVPTA